MDELRQKWFKSRVQAENRNNDYTKFAIDKKECTMVIRQNIEKAWFIAGTKNPANRIQKLLPDLMQS